ncbi:hypothetical protein Vadar_033944 [Vaccinium darrowii]|uniref:Uncharacterized protein n=1 Tax=Vaccinium darrowii TaxID=229202 RepID=A0ACB7Z0D2_9ERIC|nr:hypothetical protein Vadar_033944 [Vaccinium darrowii]
MVSKCRGLPLAIVVLEMLPKLTILVMFGCGLTELVCSCAGGFPQLQILRIVVCDVNKLQVEEGGMPVLKGLSIQGNCDLSIPDRLRTFPAPHPRIDWFEWAY